MSLSFDNIKNGNWYKLEQQDIMSGPVRIYKMEHNGNYYIKTITNSGQMRIIQIPNSIQQSGQQIFETVEPEDDYLTDEEDIPDDDDVPVEDLDQIDFIIYGENDAFVPENRSEILSNFEEIEKKTIEKEPWIVARGIHKTTRRKQRKTTRRKQRKTTRRKQRKTTRRKP